MLQRLILISLTFAASTAFGNTNASSNDAGGCGEVKVDCSTHKISFPGIEELKGTNCEDPTVIDCGAATVNGTGTVGGLHHGEVVPDGVEINNIQGMGASGGGKVFHTPNPSSGSMSCPKGADNSRGCIHICKAVLDKLKTCNGATLAITGAQAKGGSDYSDPAAPGGGGGKNNSRVSLLDSGLFEDGLAVRSRLARWISLGGLVQCVAHAQELDARDVVNTFVMKPHAMIDIASYDPATRTFQVVNLKYWGQGPLITTPEELAKSVSAIKLSRLLRNPKSFVRNQYQTDREMVLMMPELVEARRADFAAK